MYGILFPTPGDSQPPRPPPSRRISTARPESVQMVKLGWLEALAAELQLAAEALFGFRGSKRRFSGALWREGPSFA
jgi:hypothetical protein